MVNATKLHKELEAAGIPIHGVDSGGKISYKEDVTKAQKTTAERIIEDHDHYDRDSVRRDEYNNAGATLENMVVALWEKEEGRPEAWNELQAKREKIKNSIK